MKFDIWMVY